MLQKDLFKSESEINMKTREVIGKMGVIVATSLLSELRNDKKVTAEHLSSASGKFSWNKTSEKQHRYGMGKRAVNDPAKSTFVGTTQQLQCFGRVGLTNAGGVDQVKRNGDFNRITLVKKGKTVVQ